MKKIIFRAPVQTASGYGVHARMLLKALIDDGRFDITVMSVPWGATPLLYESMPFLDKIRELAGKFDPRDGTQSYDASVQVTIPNEFMRMAPVNICVTAGIETDRVPAVWQQKTNEVANMLVVPSVHSARSFTQGIYGSEKGPEQVLLRKPMYILPEWVDTSVFNAQHTDEVFDLQRKYDFPSKFNFIAVGLGMEKAEGEDRKNLVQLVRWFCEQFKGSQDVGLVLKVSMVNNSPVDFKNIRSRIQWIKAQAGCGQFPRIHLIHGRLRDEELAALYKHPKVKAMVSLTHGEGYGLPLIEAAACGLPIVATNWSGHLDFLKMDGKNKFVSIDYELKAIPPGAVWKDVLDEGTRWAWPLESDAKLKMAKVVLSYDKPKQWATELAEHISKTFNQDVSKQWVQDVYDLADGKPCKRFTNTLQKTSRSEKTLENVTLVGIADGALQKQVADAMLKSSEQIGFTKTLMLSDVGPNVIETLGSVAAYDTWVAKKLADHIDTSHALLVQHDGWVVNGSAWNDKFLEYDYIGAPWFWDPTGMNSGFMLISKRLLQELQKEEYEPSPFDVNVCKKNRDQLEKRGFKFAPPEIASKFSVENQPYEGQFGWHGENPFCG